MVGSGKNVHHGGEVVGMANPGAAILGLTVGAARCGHIDVSSPVESEAFHILTLSISSRLT